MMEDVKKGIKFEEFDTSAINKFVYEEIDSFVSDTELKNIIKNIYDIGAPRREKTYIITQLGKAFGIKDETELFPVAAAAELMMASAMNSDDATDNNKTRYGKEVLWVSEVKDKAYLISNYMYGLLFEILKKYRIADKNNNDKYQQLSDKMMEYFFLVHYGQYKTVSFENELKDLDLVKLEKLASQKAGILFEYCGLAPALFVDKKIDEMKSFGHKFGILLQYSSDARDFIKLEGEIDKPNIRYEDVYTHQPNLVLILTAQSEIISEQEREFFIETWSSVKEESREIEEKMFLIIEKSGSIQKTKEILIEMGESLKKEIEIVPDESIRLGLEGLIDRVYKI